MYVHSSIICVFQRCKFLNEEGGGRIRRKKNRNRSRREKRSRNRSRGSRRSKGMSRKRRRRKTCSVSGTTEILKNLDYTESTWSSPINASFHATRYHTSTSKNPKSLGWMHEFTMPLLMMELHRYRLLLLQLELLLLLVMSIKCHISLHEESNLLQQAILSPRQSPWQHIFPFCWW